MAAEREWKILGASRGEGGILGEGVRQALLRDPTYDPALRAAQELCPAMSVNFEVVEHPARACAALMVGAATRGGSIVLAGGSTPRAAYEHFVHAVPAVGARPRRRRRSGSGTSAASSPTTTGPTTR